LTRIDVCKAHRLMYVTYCIVNENQKYRKHPENAKPSSGLTKRLPKTASEHPWLKNGVEVEWSRAWN